MCGTSLQAQKSEVGVGFGSSAYTGDLARGLNTNTTRPGFQLFYRHNFDNGWSLRGNLLTSGVRGSDAVPLDDLGAQRNHSFSIGLAEISGTLEYHFLNYRDRKDRVNWSPYLFVGVGMFAMFGAQDNPYESYSRVQPVVPMGVGFKYLFRPYWTVGFEVGARSTFTDYLDNISGGDQAVKNYQYGNRYDNDWYYFAGLSVSYTFFKVECPERQPPKR